MSPEVLARSGKKSEMIPSGKIVRFEDRRMLMVWDAKDLGYGSWFQGTCAGGYACSPVGRLRLEKPW